jgi:nucleoid-associated protein YgaU
MGARRKLTLPPLLLVLLLTAGCGYVHLGRLPEPTTTVVGDDKLMKENADLRLEKKMLQQELALTRSQGDALRMALQNRAADGQTTKDLVEKLGQTTRELTALRASYAQLQAEKNQAVSAGAGAADLKTKLGATEEQLATALRNYTELQGEVTKLRGEIDRTRTENVALTEQVRVITSKNEQAQAALAQLNSDLLSQKEARQRAEQDAETLRTELKTVAPNSSLLAQQRTGAAAEARSLAAEHAAETAALKKEVEEMRAKADALAAEREKLTQQLATSRPPPAELATVEAKLVTALESAAQLQTENSDLKNQLTQLRQGAAGSAGTQSLRDQLRDTQSQVNLLAEENARLKDRLVSMVTGAPSQTPAASAIPPVPAASMGGGAPSGIVTIKPSPVTATLVTTVPGSKSALPAAEGAGPRFHVVTGGDTLAKISARYYGTTARWGDILAANRDVLGENNNLVVGRTLRIP